MKPKISYLADSQKKPGYFEDILNEDLLKDICKKTTGQASFDLEVKHGEYNKGRLITIDYNNCRYYVTLSENRVEGRNSSVQSVPTAINLFFADNSQNKKLCYFFIPYKGNYYTEYHKFIFRMMKTVGIIFLNFPVNVTSINPYLNIDEIMIGRRETQKSNGSNNSSYITKFENRIQIFGKTFGASKYESTLMALAAASISRKKIDFFNVAENGLTKLPESSLRTLKNFPQIEQHFVSTKLNKYAEDNKQTVNLRSEAYLYNLFQKLGEKKCCMCNCGISEIIQGAHIWNVSSIAKTTNSLDEKFAAAINGENGLWLCQNHHKLFDSNIIYLTEKGEICVRQDTKSEDFEFIDSITSNKNIDKNILTGETVSFIKKRNSELQANFYSSLED